MLTINTNLSSLIAQRSMKSATSLLNQAVERMTTGYKVNHAKDNAAAYSIITQMDTKIGAYQVAEENTVMALDMVTTASEALDLLQERVQRLRDLQEQASNGTYGEQSLKAINSECNALVDEINRLYLGSEFNGISLFLETTTDANGDAQILQEVIADTSTTFGELGISTGSFSVFDSSGTVEDTYDIAENDTLGNFLDTIKTHGLTVTIEQGSIIIDSIDGKYVNGDLITALGITTQASTYVDSTEQTSTIEVTFTETTTIPGYTYTTGLSQTSGLLDYTVTTTTTSTETSFFIKDITRRDTRYMTALSSVSSSEALADGTYKISTAAELAQLATMTNAGLISGGDEFVLAGDIDLSGYSNWTPIGHYANKFNGTFDGNGHVISNLKITSPTYYNGLFGVAENANISNIGITNIDISLSVALADAPNFFVGGLIGDVLGGIIDNCYTEGDIVAENFQYAGGLIGTEHSGTQISNSFSSCDVSAYYFSAGFVGVVHGDADIKNCFATGDVTSSVNSVLASGFTGCLVNGNIDNCYSLGNAYRFIYEIREGHCSNFWFENTNGANGLISGSGTMETPITPFTILNNATMTNELKDTTTVTATETTALSTLGLSQNGTIEIMTKAGATETSGTTSTISVSTSTTLGELVTLLQNAGIATSLSAGQLTVSGNDLVYLDSISNILTNEIGIGTGAGIGYNITTIAPVVNTNTFTLSNSTTMEKLGLSTSINVTVHNNGTNEVFFVNKNTTFAQLQANFQNKGLNVSLNNGIVSLTSNSDIYLSSSTLSTLFNLGTLNKVENATYSNSPSGVINYTVNLIDKVGNIYAPGKVELQVGINSNDNSRLEVQLAFSLSGYEHFRKIGVDGNNYLENLDNALDLINERQVEFGAVQNRLESILEEISIRRDNLISSRSTLRDADISDVSSQYIKQQILQQASATLMATANQSPSIALQLI